MDASCPSCISLYVPHRDVEITFMYPFQMFSFIQIVGLNVHIAFCLRYFFLFSLVFLTN